MISLRDRLLDKCWRIAYRLAYPVAKLWWRVVGAEGVRIAIWCNGRVLTVHHSYKLGLQMPGGGLKRGEHPSQAAIRELQEELSITVQPAQVARVLSAPSPYGLVHLYEISFDIEPKFVVDRREIVAALFLQPHLVDEPNVMIKLYLASATYRELLAA